LDVEPESEVMKLANRLYDELQANGVDVILDDRLARPGIKFKDSELAGFPLRIGIGERSLSKGQLEIKPRVGEMILCSPDDALGQVFEWLEANRVG
ncbi:MAG: His/Gly/Thr/Pro-type tRNA ligase C-terminal domain-containing protein, partial [Verrucomicrobiota bacterium]|nr:His/Gly/Thr/Pro-type tRNA ligase C-terminal domain-containing protein [Verrucomicrobiota bacterium]